MAGTGPPPKPGAQRHRTGKPALSMVALPKREPPPIPKHAWLKVTREGWTAFWDDPISTISEDSDLPELVRLFDLRDERERGRREIRRRGRLLEMPTTGAWHLNPLTKYVKELDAEIRALEDRFGLSPLARLRLGITFGEFSKALQSVNRALEDDDEEGSEVADGNDPRIAAVQLADRDV